MVKLLPISELAKTGSEAILSLQTGDIELDHQFERLGLIGNPVRLHSGPWGAVIVESDGCEVALGPDLVSRLKAEPA
jgi:hypothetical protein